jgi:threonine/homoserine/homoserine lactone efflux protein
LSESFALFGILAALAVGTVSPGPSFVMVARTAAAQSRSDGVAAALGMGLGGFFLALLALLGLQAVLAAVPVLYAALKILGGLYLAWLGWRIWRAAAQPLDVSAGPAPSGRAFLLGLATQVSNPKTALVYASVFAAFLPPQHGIGFAAALLLLIFLLEAGWYALVALVLSAEQPRAAYLRGKAWIDRTAGAVLMLLGIKLAFDPHRA